MYVLCEYINAQIHIYVYSKLMSSESHRHKSHPSARVAGHGYNLHDGYSRQRQRRFSKWLGRGGDAVRQGGNDVGFVGNAAFSCFIFVLLMVGDGVCCYLHIITLLVYYYYANLLLLSLLLLVLLVLFSLLLAFCGHYQYYHSHHFFFSTKQKEGKK